MANFAKLDENNTVLEVIVVNNNSLDPLNEEMSGITFLTELLGYSNWKQTSYNATIRKNYAGIGMTYDQIRDAFIAPKPEGDCVLNEQTCKWEKIVPDSE